MKTNSDPTDIGVIVGRFQTHELHEEHVRLINHVVERHSKVAIFLGVSRAVGTKRNPMDFVTRKEMILDRPEWKKVTVLPMADQKSDEKWSLKLDYEIREIFPLGSVTLYGGRDSFINHYTGVFPTEALEPQVYVSATAMRKQCGREVLSTPQFRAGVIYSTQNRFTNVFPTVDVAPLRFTQGVGWEVALVRKPAEEHFRFAGGFVDPKDPSLQAAVRREGKEETGLDLDGLEFINSYRQNDWRYASEDEKIMTTFFAALSVSGVPKPGDDVCELIWVPVQPVQFTGDLNMHLENVDKGLCRHFRGVQIEPEHHQLSMDLVVFVERLIRKEINETTRA